MTYNAKYNQQKEKYRKAKFKRIGIDVTHEYYESTLKPAADAENMPVGTFIKSCVDKEIKRISKK